MILRLSLVFVSMLLILMITLTNMVRIDRRYQLCKSVATMSIDKCANTGGYSR